MATITFKGSPISTSGDLPSTGSPAPDFTLCSADLEDVSLSDFSGAPVILNIVPSLDTGVCQASARRFNEEAGAKSVKVANISCDLPFAMGRFCGGEGLDHLLNLSAFRSPEFQKDYGVEIVDGPLRGLCCRAVVVIDAAGNVVYTELVPEIAQEPDYDAALASLS
jgi:thiol peroxidase